MESRQVGARGFGYSCRAGRKKLQSVIRFHQEPRIIVRILQGGFQEWQEAGGFEANQRAIERTAQ